jgi:hypothetical protein
MKRLSTYLITAIVAAVIAVIFAAVATHRPHFVAANMENQTSAAYRDGLFLARLDAEQGRKPHLMSGRWSSDGDRRLFVAAYLHAYREMRGDTTAEQLEPSQPAAAKRGYRDGLADGLQRRYESRSFQATATESYRKADRGYSDNDGDLNQYMRAYREAYCNAYQLAFYGEPQEIQTVAVLRRSAPE